MTDEPIPWFARPLARTAAVLAMLAYLPALTAAPGRMPSDSKLYLYLDPGRFFGDAAASFDGRQFAGWVPHQHVAYLWPGLPWFWSFDTLGVPDWIAHRLWIGTIMLAAGLGVRWVARLLGLGPTAALTAAIVYQVSLYVLPYVSRTSVMLLPWAGLGWIVAFTVRASRRGGWGDPAAAALIVLTVGAVNATALAMIIPGPVLWLVHAAWQRSMSWRAAALTAVKVGVLSLAVSLWWIAMLVIQGRHGTDVLPYSESLADVSLTSTAPEAWRSLGYWLFYVRDPAQAATSESLRYLSSTWSIAVSFALPLLALTSLAFVSWSHRRFAALLIGSGLVLAVGVHPIGDRSPLMRVFAGSDDGGLALALRSSTRALPVAMLGVALALAMATEALRSVDRSMFGVRQHRVAGGAVCVLAILNLPALWTGGFVDTALERDQDPPVAWRNAAAALDADGGDGRVLQLPGAEFGAFRWGYTVDQPLPGLVDRPLVTRDLLPLGSTAAMDLLYAFDDRVQDGTVEAASIAPVARLLGVDTVWLANDLAFDRFRTARPEVVRDVVVDAPGVDRVDAYGEPFLNRPDVPMTDERAVGDRRVGAPLVPVELAHLGGGTSLDRARSDVLSVSGSGDGLVDAAASGLIAPGVAAVRYTADEDTTDDSMGLLVTDSNRDRARHWRSSQDTTGYTEPGGPEQDVLREVDADARLELFDSVAPETQTVALQQGPVTATATSYGEPFAYLPEHRPVMAIDGDPTTAWLVGEHGDPIGETLRLRFDEPVDRLVLHQPRRPEDRHIVAVSYAGHGLDDRVVSGTTQLSEESWAGTGQELRLEAGVVELDLTIDAVAGGVPFTGSAVAGVGFTEIEHGLGATTEVVRPPHDALPGVDASTPLALSFTRLRTDPMDRWRDDPEPVLVREFDLAGRREFVPDVDVRIDARATDAALAELFGWPAVASTRLTGSPRHAGVSAIDGDLETAWITAFDEAEGATLSTTTSEPIGEVAVRQPVTGFSRVVTMSVQSAGQRRDLTLTPDAAGIARVSVDPPLPAGAIEFVITEIEPLMTNDRRFGDPVTLPASITEIDYAGRPTTQPLADRRWSADCTPLMVVGGVTVPLALSLDDAGWLDGESITARPCSDGVTLAAGTHVVHPVAHGLPLHLDRVVLDDGLRTALSVADRAPWTTTVETGQFGRTLRVDGCSSGCWLVFGEGFNTAWSATASAGDLGPPTLLDGGFNGWWLDGSTGSIDVEVRWTAQTWLIRALLLSALAAAVCVALVLLDRRPRAECGRHSEAPSVPATAPMSNAAPMLIVAVWVVTAGALIGPEWALWGAVGGLAAVAARRHRVAELTSLASVVVIAAFVVVRERRSAPRPDGAWPATFESLHELGMFAIAALLVAALFADDAAGSASNGTVGRAVGDDEDTATGA